MTIYIDNVAVIEDKIAPDDAFAVDIDISEWLDSDTISSVAYTAVDGKGNSETANAIDVNKCTNTQTVIKPYLTGNTNGERYIVKCVVTTTGGDKKTFYVIFECKEFAQ